MGLSYYSHWCDRLLILFIESLGIQIIQSLRIVYKWNFYCIGINGIPLPGSFSYSDQIDFRLLLLPSLDLSPYIYTFQSHISITTWVMAIVLRIHFHFLSEWHLLSGDPMLQPVWKVWPGCHWLEIVLRSQYTSHCQCFSVGVRCIGIGRIVGIGPMCVCVFS